MIDSQLFDRAQNALAQTPHMLRHKIQVEARLGRVILSGTVKSFFHKQLAQEALRHIEGLHSIDNQLQVDWAPGAPAPRLDPS